MTDIVERLRKFVTGCDKPECQRMIFTPLVCEEAAAEIERLRAGGCARDQSTTQYCAEAAEKDAHIRRITLDYLGQIGQLSDEITKLRAALRRVSEVLCSDCHMKAFYAAIEIETPTASAAENTDDR